MTVLNLYYYRQYSYGKQLFSKKNNLKITNLFSDISFYS